MKRIKLIILNIIFNFLNALPECMWNKTKCDYVCPKRIIFTKLKKPRLWKYLWWLCVIECKRRLKVINNELEGFISKGK